MSDISIIELAKKVNLRLTNELTSALEKHGIRTLQDIRTAGGLGQLGELPTKPDDSAIKLLEAHANLAVLTDDAATRTHLIDCNYKTVIDVAESNSAVFKQKLGGKIGVERAAKIYAQAQSAVAWLNNLRVGLHADPIAAKALGYDVMPLLDEHNDEAPSVVSPVSYLTDLLDYATKHLTPRTGLNVEYWCLGEQKAAYLETNIDISWGTEAPAPGVDPANFVVNWVGCVSPQHSETYTFTLTMDRECGGSVSIDGEEITSFVSGSGVAAGSIGLESGRFYEIRVTVWVHKTNAFARLEWESPSQKKEVVPAERLYPSIPSCALIDSNALAQLFRQPFGDVAQSEEAVSQAIHQVRLCVEVLRQFLSYPENRPAPGSQAEANLNYQLEMYRQQVYEALLKQAGSSYDEVRQAATADHAARQALTDRLGFDLDPRVSILVGGDFDGDGVDEIALAPRAEGSPGNAFRLLKYNANTRVWGRMTPGAALPFDADFVCSAPEFPHGAKFAVTGYFTTEEHKDIAVAAAMPGVAFWVMSDVDPDSADPAQRWKHCGSGDPGGLFDIDIPGTYLSARFAVAGDFDGDGLDELAICTGERGPRADTFWVMDYGSTTGTPPNSWDQLGTVNSGDLSASFICQGMAGKPIGTAQFAVAGDFDGDNRDELAVVFDSSNGIGTSLWIMRWDIPSKTWKYLNREVSKAGEVFTCSSSQTILWAVVGDFDNHRPPRDLLVLAIQDESTHNQQLRVMEYIGLQAPPSGWRVHSTYDTYSPSSPIALLFAGDFDGDQRLEICILCQSPLDKQLVIQVIRCQAPPSLPGHPNPSHWDVVSTQSQFDLLDSGSGSGLPRLGQAVAGKFSATPMSNMSAAKAELAIALEVDCSHVAPDRSPIWTLTFNRDRRAFEHLSPRMDHPWRVDLICDPRPDRLDQLLLEPEVDRPPQELMECTLDILFGWRSTRRRDTSISVRIEQEYNMPVAHWHFQGAHWNRNIDPDGCIYLRYVPTADDAGQIQVFSDPKMTRLVASGALSSTSAEVDLTEDNHSGLTGTLVIVKNEHMEDATACFCLIPKLGSWRLEHLRRQWYAQDWPQNTYEECGLPIIDPDLVGPEDFRYPYQRPNASAQLGAFDLWTIRRAWVDQQLEQFTHCVHELTDAHGQSVSVPDIDAMFRKMKQPVPYQASVLVTVIPWDGVLLPDTLDALLSQLRAQSPDQSQVARDIKEKLALTPDSFTRLMALRHFAVSSQSDLSSLQPTEQNWQEVYSILMQAMKVRLFEAWSGEEKSLNIQLGPEEFWSAFSEPMSGQWPPTFSDRDCLINPDVITMQALPNPDFGLPVIRLWKQRRQWLDQQKAQLRAACEERGVQAAIDDAYGQPMASEFSSWYSTLTAVPIDEQRADWANAQIQSRAKLTVSDFCRLMNLLEMSLQPGKSVTKEQYWWLYTLLAQVRRRLLPSNQEWSGVEKTAGITLETWWKVFRHSLPPWRASETDRQQWSYELSLNCRMPLVDPDLITQEHTVWHGTINPARSLWDERYTWREAQQDLYKAAKSPHETDGSKLAFTDPVLGSRQGQDAIDTILIDVLLGVPAVSDAKQRFSTIRDLNDLDRVIVNELDSSPQRLEEIHRGLVEDPDPIIFRHAVTQELGCSLTDFQQLLEVRHRLQNPPISSNDLDIVSTVLATATLIVRLLNLPREAGDMRARRLAQLSLDETQLDFLFEIRDVVANRLSLTDADWTSFSQALVSILKVRQSARWLAKEKAYGVVLSPDYFTIPDSAAPTPGFPIASGWPKWELQAWEKRLLDRREQEQALLDGMQSQIDEEEVTILPVLRDTLITAADLSSVGFEANAKFLAEYLFIDTQASGNQRTTRTAFAIESLQGILWSARAGLLNRHDIHLDMRDEDFDTDWKWLGSYATWQAAMLAFLFPENLLLPRLRPVQTLAFGRLMDGISKNQPLTLDTARQLAGQYADYLKEICSFQQVTGIEIGGVSYFFARRPSGQVDWCTVADRSDLSVRPILWSELETIANVASLIGAVGYWTEGKTFVYIFAKSKANYHPGIVGSCYDVGTQRWDAMAVSAPFALPPDPSGFTAMLMPSAETESPRLALQTPGDTTYVGEVVGTKVEFRAVDYSIPESKWAGAMALPEFELDMPTYHGASLSAACLGTSHRPSVFAYLGTADSANTREHSPRYLGYFRVYAFDSSGQLNGISDDLWVPNYPNDLNRPPDKEIAALFEEIKGSGLAVVNLADNTTLVVAFVMTNVTDNPGKPEYGTHYYYRTGRIVDLSDSTPVHWSAHWVEVPANRVNPTDAQVDERSLSITVAELEDDDGNTNPNLIIFYLSGAKDSEKQGKYLIGRGLRSDGVRTWAGPFTVPGLFGVRSHGAAIAVTGLDDDPKANDLIILNIEHPISGIVAENSGKIRIGRGLKLDSGVNDDKWIECVPVPGSFGEDSGGAGIAACDVDESDRLGERNNPELFVFHVDHVDHESPVSKGFYRVGWNIGTFKMQDTQPQLQPSGGTPTFSGPFEITEQRSQAELQRLKALQEDVYKRNEPDPTSLVYLQEAWYFVPVQIALALQASGEYLAALNWFRTVYDYEAASEQRKIYYGLKLEESCNNVVQRGANWLQNQLDPHRIAGTRTNAYTRYTLISIIRCLIDYADSEFTCDTSEAVAHARLLYYTALGLLDLPELAISSSIADGRGNAGGAEPCSRSVYRSSLAGLPELGGVPWQNLMSDGELQSNAVLCGLSVSTCAIPPNPVVVALRSQAELNLAKLEQGHNIADLERELELYSAPTSVGDITPKKPSSQVKLHPTIYRYVVLIERAKQLATTAGQMEDRMFASLKEYSNVLYTQLKARQDLQLARSTLQLHDLQIVEANVTVDLAQLQQQRAKIQSDTYQSWINAGMNQYEQEMIQHYREAGDAQKTAADFALISSAMGGISQGVNAGASIGGVAGVIVGILVGGLNEVSSFGSWYNNRQAVDATVAGQIAAVNATHARREEEWKLQRDLADQDIAIGQGQITLSQDHVAVVQQERNIAQLQRDNAEAVVNFLEGQFPNVSLYEWMSGVLEQIYRFFLQQAVATARLAETQLAFERQEVIPAFIQRDYWQPPQDESMASSSNGTGDRHGLTGSARLLQDIYRLDQHAFGTNKRKLQLTKTISLSQLDPYAFQVFRRTGVMTFATPMSLFDRDFPGHYLRLIHRVRTSVIALIPPVDGIKATLTASGVSRVITRGNTFRTVVIRCDPQSVALTSPTNATGLFELDTQADMLNPFEAMGVDTLWTFEMPTPSNRIDFRTIADVLITIEYTALSDASYRQQIIQSLDRTLSAQRSFSFRQQFADQWYELNNPNQSDTPMVVRFQTRREDYGPNIGDLKIDQVLLYFAQSTDHPFEVTVERFAFKPDRAPQLILESVTTSNGLISSAQISGASWSPLIGKKPVGEWELTLPNDDGIKAHFMKEEVEDILFVIAFSGQTPEWRS